MIRHLRSDLALLLLAAAAIAVVLGAVLLLHGLVGEVAAG